MSFGIQIGVDARQVKDAKKVVGDLADTLERLSKNDVDLGGVGFSKDAEIVRQASQDVTRLGNISRSGESKGGVLNLQQFKDAATLSARVSANLGDWIKQSQKLREELKKVNEDIAGLQRASMDTDLSAGARAAILSELGGLQEERDRLSKEIEGRGRLDARAGMVRDRVGEYAANIAGYGTHEDTAAKAQRGMLSMLQKTLGTITALVGGASLMALAHQSIEKYKEIDTAAADMGALGMRPSAGAADYLFAQRTQAQMALARSTGYGDARLVSAAARLSRARAMDLGQTTDFMGSVYSSTGMDAKGIVGLTAGTFAITKNTKRQVDVLEGIQKLLQTQAARQGGPVSREQAATLAALYAGNFEKSVTLQQTTAYDKLNNWMTGDGGSPGEQLLRWKISGGDKWNGSSAGLVKILSREAEGLSNPENVAGLRQYLAGLKDPYLAQMALRSMAHLQVGNGREADLIMKNVINSGLDVRKDQGTIIANLAHQGASEKTIQSIYPNYRGSAARGYALSREATQMKIGQDLGPEVLKLLTTVQKDIRGFVDMAHSVHGPVDALEKGGEWLAKSVKDIFESGPLGKMLVVLGSINAGVGAIALYEKARATGTAATSVTGKVLRMADKSLAGWGPSLAGVYAAYKISEAQPLNNIDEVAAVKAWTADKKHHNLPKGLENWMKKDGAPNGASSSTSPDSGRGDTETHRRLDTTNSHLESLHRAIRAITPTGPGTIYQHGVVKGSDG